MSGSEPDSVSAQEEPAAEPELHASWLELFFDLVVVVAVALLAERLHEDPGWHDLARVTVMYLAVWLVWTSFVLYANVTAERAHRQAILAAMACIAVMAAAVPGVEQHSHGAAFAVAFLLARVVAIRTFRATGKAVLDWPIAQMSVGMVPWVVSIWADGDTQLMWWALGLLLDIGFAVFGDGQQILDRLNTGRRRDAARVAGRRGRGPGGRRGIDGRTGRRRRGAGGGLAGAADVTAATVNVGHFDERLGVFMIIVLGEAVTQVVTAATHLRWDWAFRGAAASAFVLLVGLWWLTFQYGFAAAPQSKLAGLSARFALPIHFVTTGSVVGIATGLGVMVAHPGAAVPDGHRWLACAALSTYFTVTAVGAVAARAPRSWLLGWALPTVLAPLAIGVLAAGLPGWAVGMLLAVVVWWQVGYGWLRGPGGRRTT